MPDNQGISVSVNGETVSVPTGSTVAELLVRLALAGRPVAVEHNRRVVPRAEHAAVRLNHGDTLEIVTFVGGGSGGDEERVRAGLRSRGASAAPVVPSKT